MEDQFEELVNLAEQEEKQAASEKEPKPLIELEEKMEQRKDTVESLGQSLKETIPAEFKERVQQAVRDSIKIVEEGKQYLGHVRARLEFLSADSEARSNRGPTGQEQRGTPGAIPRGGWRGGTERRRTA